MSSNIISKLKFLLKDSLVFGLTNALSKFFAIFLTPILTAILTKEEFGQMDLLTPYISLWVSLIIFGLDSGVPRFIYDDKENEGLKISVASTGFWLQTLFAVVFCGILFLFKNLFLEKIVFKPQLEMEFFLILGVIFFTSFLRFGQNLSRWLLLRKEFLIISIGYIISNFGFIVLFVTYLEYGVFGVFLGQLISSAIFSVIALYLIRHNLAFTFNLKLFKPILWYSFPLMLVALLPAFIPALDRLAINKYLGLEYIAFYGIGYRIITFISLPLQSINTAIGPFIYNHYQEDDAGVLFDKILKIAAILTVISILMIISFSGYINDLIADRTYIKGLIILAPLMLAQGVEFLSSILCVGIELSKKTYLNIVIQGISLASFVIFLFFLTPLLGLYGVALAILVSKVFQILIGSYLAARAFKLRMNRTSIFLQLIIGVAFTTPHYFYYNFNNERIMLIGLMSMLVYIIFIILFERKLLKSFSKYARLKLIN